MFLSRFRFRLKQKKSSRNFIDDTYHKRIGLFIQIYNLIEGLEL